MRKRVMDVVVLLGLAVLTLVGAGLCSQMETGVKPVESDCIEELRAATRKTTNFNEEELIRYGRCLVERSR